MRSVVASANGTVTMNVRVSTMKFGSIGKTQMICYSEICSHVFSMGTGTALAGRNNCSDFPSKPAKNQGKWRKTRGTSRCNFL